MNEPDIRYKGFYSEDYLKFAIVLIVLLCLAYVMCLLIGKYMPFK